jgi:hypothetical protein
MNCGKKVRFTPAKKSQNCVFPIRSLSIRPVTFGNQ